MRQYLDLVKYILENGEKKEDRTGVGTISVFGYQSKYQCYVKAGNYHNMNSTRVF